MLTPIVETEVEVEEWEFMDLSLWRLVLQVHAQKHSSPGNFKFVGEYWSICSDKSNLNTRKDIRSFGSILQLWSRLPSQHSTYMSYAAITAIVGGPVQKKSNF
jgi:hypothetical protein